MRFRFCPKGVYKLDGATAPTLNKQTNKQIELSHTLRDSDNCGENSQFSHWYY